MTAKIIPFPRIKPSGIACKDCGDQISLARRKAAPGCKRCAEREREHEDSLKARQRFARPSDYEIIRG